jgi:hypothetical protein
MTTSADENLHFDGAEDGAEKVLERQGEMPSIAIP